MPEREVKLFRLKPEHDHVTMFLPKETFSHNTHGIHVHLTEEDCIQLGKMFMDMGTSKIAMLMMQLRQIPQLASNYLKRRNDR